MEKCKELFRNYKELILYVFFGGLTTVVNWVGYWLSLIHIYKGVRGSAAPQDFTGNMR